MVVRGVAAVVVHAHASNGGVRAVRALEFEQSGGAHASTHTVHALHLVTHWTGQLKKLCP
jgi:hypothetical protein